MNKRYTKSFKIQAVEKALNRPAESSLKEAGITGQPQSCDNRNKTSIF